jgi:tight adherence protein C
MTALLVLACAALAVGIALVVSWAAARRPSLDARMARYVRPADGGAWVTHTASPRFAPARLAAPVIRDLGRVLERWGSSAADVQSRLDRSGSPLGVEQFRAQQVAWGAIGLAGGFAAATMLRVARGAPLVTLLIIVGACAIGAALARDGWLTHAAHKRTERIVAELPTIADLLALSVAAGEGARSALERVARTTSGALPHELRRALTDARSGEPLSRALQDMAVRTRAQPLQRFVDGIVAALDLGTPLAGVLRAQAHDARVAGREQLMEQGGKREIAMLVPVVFLILPVTIVFAIYPGLIAIRLTG